VSTDRPAYTLFVRPEVTSVDQLRGKRIGVEGFGGATAMALTVALKHYGIDAMQDMVLLQIGGDQLQLESMRNGATDAAALLAPIALLARADGFTPLLKLADLAQMPQGGLSTTLTKLTQERDQARRVVRAHMQAQQWIVQNREATVQFLADLIQMDPADAEAAYDEAIPTYQGKGQVTRAGIESYLQVLRDNGRVRADARYEDVADNSLAEEIGRELGLIP
jgi:NitT/TauT family transport system substrate-binding protein